MKTNYTIIVTLLTGIMISYSQPVLNATDFTSYYNSDDYLAENIVGLSAGNAGPDQTWDFSGLTNLSLNGTLNVVPFATSPYAGAFPTANFVFKSSNTIDTEVNYSYYNSSPTTFESVGEASSTDSYLDVDPMTIFQFPYSYNTVINDSYQLVAGDPVYSFTSTYDGYGTLITPYGTYSNVIRQKTVQVNGDYTYTDYIWLTTNPFKYIMGAGFWQGPVTSYNYVDVFTNFTNLGVNRSNKEKLVTVYPNPATSVLNLNFANTVTIDKVVIIDLTGKIVKQQTENTTQINVEKFATGLYIIEAYSGNEKFQTKFIKE